MCGGGDQTVTTTQQSMPGKAVRQAGKQQISDVMALSDAPYTLPAQPVADFTDLQNQAFGQIAGLGADSPYLAAANAAFGNAGQPITQDDINSYLNPYRDAALANMNKYIFGPQRRDTMGQARAQAGGPSADRLALTSQNLDFTQADALSQALAGYYNSATGQAQRAKEMAMASGQGYLGLQGAAQGAANNVYAAGAQQQALEQAKLNAPYMQQREAFMWPYQAEAFGTQNLAALQGTQGTTQTGTTNYPGPSAGSQILGGLTAAAGLAMGNPMMAAGGAKGASGMGNYAYNPAPGMGNFSPVYVPGYGYMPQAAKRGGRIQRRAAGGSVNPWDFGRGYDDGGIAEFDDRFPAVMDDPAPIAPATPLPFMSRAQPAVQAIQQGTFDPRGANATGFSPPRTQPPYLPPPPPPPPPVQPPQVTVSPRPPVTPPAQPPVLQRPNPDPSIDLDSFFAPREKLPYPDSPGSDWGQKMARNPWMSLVSAGAKMMQTPGGIGRAIGAGLEAGVGHLESERKSRMAEAGVNQRAQKLYEDAMTELKRFQRGKFQQSPFMAGNDPLTFSVDSGRYISGTTGQPVGAGTPLTQASRGSLGSKDPAVVRTAQWMVDNGIAPTLADAYKKIKESNRDSSAYRSLIRQYFSEILKADPMIDRDEAQREAERRAKAGVDGIQ